ncbi:MAG: hypothetical protein APR63_14160 [Desulfuromonas sp. SDB]|nr:MAG: hypothetical protein APR63_14160 [Desulfuromonas sp. SDB]
MMDDLWKDRLIFEYWAHGASIIPLADFNYYLPLINNYPWGNKRLSAMEEKYKHTIQKVYERIEKEGPLKSSDFKSDKGKRGDGWWEWKPAKTALEILYWKGKLMVDRREKFQKVYDITSRVLPEKMNLEVPPEKKIGNFFTEKALSNLGIAELPDIYNYIRAVPREILQDSIDQMLKRGKVVELKIPGNTKTYFCLTENINENTTIYSSAQLNIINPFDNFVINRNRLKTWFDFEYQLECYLLEKKRKFGYFALPLFYQNKFVGRMDCKVFRKKKTLMIRQLSFEKKCKPGHRFINTFRHELRNFADFNNCKNIEINSVKPVKYKKAIITEIGRIL